MSQLRCAEGHPTRRARKGDKTLPCGCVVVAERSLQHGDNPRTRLVGLRRLHGCFYRTGRLSRSELFLASYADGAVEIVRPVYCGHTREAVIYVPVETIPPPEVAA